MHDSFPKRRPPLPKEIQEIYSLCYKSNRKGRTTASSLSQKMESWMHRKVARDVRFSRDSSKLTLELGAGTLNQLPYEPMVHSYDIIEPSSYLYSDSPYLSRIQNIYPDISAVPANFRYDRITSVAALEHICNLPEVIARSGLLLAENGVFRSSIPNEGTPLWTLAWKLTTGLEFRLIHGFDYGLLMKHEHVNTADEIERILTYFFTIVDYEVFGISKHISLYRYYECRSPNLDRCQNYITEY